jgi:secreted trypsin-like serine protease
MLLILEGRSSYPTIRLNSLPKIPENNVNLQVVGWGRQDINAEKVSDDLRRVNVTYFDNTYCKNTIDFTDDMMCAKGYNQSGPCKGDSGGPLILSGNSSNMDLQLGILSFPPVECTHRKFFVSMQQTEWKTKCLLLSLG